MKLNNDNFLNLVNFIDTSYNTITIKDLIIYACQSGLYKDLYLNFHILNELINEHNKIYIK